jgi:hypothetical protein
MKRLLFILLLAALTACDSNSLVNTPTLASTPTPIPTLTEVPEMTRPFGNDGGLIGEGKIGPWVEATKVEPSEALKDNVKKLSKDSEAVVLEVKDAAGKTGQMVFVMEKDANGQVTRRFVAWDRDNLGVKRLVDNGVINDLDELLPLPDGQGFGVMGADGVLEPVILIGADGQMVLVDNFIQVMQQGGQQEAQQITADVKNDLKEVGDALGVNLIPPEKRAMAVALFEQMGIDSSTYDLKMDGEAVVGIDKVTGEEVFRDGKFELRYAVENAKDLVPTKYKPRSEAEIGNVNRPREDMVPKYIIPLLNRARVELKNIFGFDPVV